MLRRLTIAAALTGALALALFGATANAQGAGKVTLLSSPSGSCNIGATAGSDTNAFAVINFNNAGKVGATVSIKDGAANATYSVSLVQIPSGEDCFTAEAELTTNGQGNGTTQLSEDVLPGTTGAFVLVQQTGGFDFRVTKPVSA